MSLPSDFIDNEWVQPTINHLPPPKSHPHPLRSNSSEDVKSIHREIDTAIEALQSDRPDSGIFSNPHHHRRSRSIYTYRGERNPLDVPQSPLPTHPAFRNAPTERLSDTAVPDTQRIEYPVVYTRPPFKPTISFGGETRVSYYSISTATSSSLDEKSKAVAAEEELQTRSRPASQLSFAGKSTWRFYASFAVLCVLRFVCGMNTTSLTTALPTIAQYLGTNAVLSFWIPSSFLLASTLLQPLFMRLTYALGGRTLLSLSIAFCIGGTLACGMAKTFPIIILGRSIAGAGSGALGVLTQVILHQTASTSDISIYERSTSLIYWLGAAIGPCVGGAVVQTMSWRFIFWLNVPFGAFAIIALPFLLELNADQRSDWRELISIDYLGWILLAGSMISVVISLAWAGSMFTWSSPQVVAPLIVGVVALLFFLQYSRHRHEPIMPLSILRKPTAIITCFGTMVHGMLFTAVVYLLPLYLEAAAGLTAAKAGATLLPWTLSLVVAGAISGALLGRCGTTWPMTIGWTLVTTGAALTIVLRPSITTAITIPLGLLTGVGFGMLFPAHGAVLQGCATTDDEAIHAAPLHNLFSTLGQTLGIAVGSCIFINALQADLASSRLTGDSQTYANNAVRLIPVIQRLGGREIALRTILVDSYTDALRWVWLVMCIFASMAFLLSIWVAISARKRRKTEQRGHELRDRTSGRHGLA